MGLNPGLGTRWKKPRRGISKAKIEMSGGAASAMDSVLALHPAGLGLIPGVPKNFSDFLMFLRLIDSTAA